jgi:hypothetical protein
MMFGDASQSGDPKLVKVEATYTWSDGYELKVKKVGEDLVAEHKAKPGYGDKPGNANKP